MLPARVYQAARWVSRVVEVRNERVTGHGMPGGSLGPRGSEFRVIVYRLRLYRRVLAGNPEKRNRHVGVREGSN